MYILLAVLAFVYGLVFGSFFNVCIYRIPLGISVAKGHSFCPTCKTRIRWYDLVPVLSFIMLRGKCRGCGEPISPRYTVVELLTAALYLAAYLVFGVSVDTLIMIILFSCLVILSFTDLEHQLIPDRFPIIIFSLGIINAAYGYFCLDKSPLTYIIGLFAVSVPFFILSCFGAMGGGDVKLMAAAGLLLGWEKILLATLIGSVVGAVFAVIFMIRKKAGRKTEVPFGPFLSIGISATALCGDALIGWYGGLFAA